MPHGLREEELVLLSTGKSNCRERERYRQYLDGCDAFLFLLLSLCLRVKVAPILSFCKSQNHKLDYIQVDCLTISGDLFGDEIAVTIQATMADADPRRVLRTRFGRTTHHDRHLFLPASAPKMKANHPPTDSEEYQKMISGEGSAIPLPQTEPLVATSPPTTPLSPDV